MQPAPVANQILIATSTTNATWQYPVNAVDRVLFGGTDGVFDDSAAFRFDGTNVTMPNLRTTDDLVHIGSGSGISQDTNSVAIGTGAGAAQSTNSVAIGQGAGATQAGSCVAIGDDAGTSQLVSAVAIGQQAGELTQGQEGIAIGYQAGQSNQLRMFYH